MFVFTAKCKHPAYFLVFDLCRSLTTLLLHLLASRGLFWYRSSSHSKQLASCPPTLSNQRGQSLLICLSVRPFWLQVLPSILVFFLQEICRRFIFSHSTWIIIIIKKKQIVLILYLICFSQRSVEHPSPWQWWGGSCRARVTPLNCAARALMSSWSRVPTTAALMTRSVMQTRHRWRTRGVTCPMHTRSCHNGKNTADYYIRLL